MTTVMGKWSGVLMVSEVAESQGIIQWGLDALSTSGVDRLRSVGHLLFFKVKF